jgi:hypothetical protein
MDARTAALTLSAALPAVLAVSSACASGVHSRAGSPAGMHRGHGGPGFPTVPSLTDQGRFVHGPAFGHPPILGPRLQGAARHRTPLVTTPLVVPYAVPVYPVAPAVPVYEHPAVPPAPLPVAAAPASRPDPPGIVPAPPTSIYYCVETRTYTNEPEFIACPAGWRKMTR